MKFLSWNVNGIRACSQNEGWKQLWSEGRFDVLCLQEVKAFPEQLDFWLREPKGFSSHWHPAQKPGYSGVAVYTRKDPQNVTYGLGDPEIDAEGRVITLDFGSYALVNAYFPNSQREHTRLPFKLKFCATMHAYLDGLRAKGKEVILCGDFNVAHNEIDLRNPKSNMKNAGFLPEERAWMTAFLGKGYIDTFRHFTPHPDHYTWWSYRPGVREKNIGWRLDYFVTGPDMKDRLDDARIYPQVFGSDHCPVGLDLKG